MILLRHHQSDHPMLKEIDDDYPFTYLRSYHAWEQSNGTETGILWEEQSDISIPVKFYRRKFFVFAQFIFQPLHKKQPLSKPEEKNFITEAIDYLKNCCRVQRILPSPAFFNFQQPPDGSNYCPFGVYVIDLEQSEDSLFKNIQSRTRRYIQNASNKNELQLKTGIGGLNDFYRLHAATMKREGAKYESLTKMKRLIECLSPNNILCVIAYRDHVPEAGLIVPFSNYCGVLFYGGEADNSIAATSNKWLHWEAMRQLKKKNVKKVVLGGKRMGNLTNSKYEGIQFFKERFGPVIQEGFLWKIDMNPGMTHFYDTLLKTRKFITGSKSTPDIIDFYHQRNPVT